MFSLKLYKTLWNTFGSHGPKHLSWGWDAEHITIIVWVLSLKREQHFTYRQFHYLFRTKYSILYVTGENLPVSNWKFNWICCTSLIDNLRHHQVILQAISCHWTSFPIPEKKMVLIVSLSYLCISVVGILSNSLVIYIWCR